VKARNPLPTLRGDRWRQNYLGQVVAILGSDAPPVSSRGRRFVNKDRWTLRFLTALLCEWAHSNPTSDLTQGILEGLVEGANLSECPHREIVVARTPDQLDLRTGMALIGGADHEAFHGRYSCKRSIKSGEVSFILDLWPCVPDWSRFHKLIQTWSNVVEDIRIERAGRVEYPGTLTKLHDLQDFILKQEAQGEKSARSHGVNTKGALSIIMKTFRDLGLGYVTPTQEEAIQSYRNANPQAVELVLHGPLRGLLEESMELAEGDDAACLRIALEVIATLYALSSKVYCPNCGARGSKLTVRPKLDDQGNKVEGKALVTCSECNWEGEIDLPTDDEGEEDNDDVRFEDPKWEGFDKEDKDKPGGGGGLSPEGGGIGDEKEGTDTEAIPTGKKVEAGAPEGDSDGAKGAGDTPSSDGAWSGLADEALDQAEQDLNIMDNNTALGEAVNAAQDKEDSKGGTRPTEARYRPYDTGLDQVQFIRESYRGKKADDAVAMQLLQSVRHECSFLRARLRNIMRAMEMSSVLHGAPKGRKLSERHLVDTMISVRSGEPPQKAFIESSQQIDTSLAAAVVQDESGSMRPLLAEATRMLCALTEPLDGLKGCKVQASGFRSGRRPSEFPVRASDCHRTHGVIHDVFKTFDEPFRAVRWRFANTRASGGTPMADGIQFGLDALSERPEHHLVLFVITDGEPDPGHQPVILRQLRLAKEAGIHVIGVGIGEEATFVKTLFPDHVWSKKVSEAPKLLIAKLNELVDTKVRRRQRTKIRP